MLCTRDYANPFIFLLANCDCLTKPFWHLDAFNPHCECLFSHPNVRSVSSTDFSMNISPSARWNKIEVHFQTAFHITGFGILILHICMYIFCICRVKLCWWITIYLFWYTFLLTYPLVTKSLFCLDLIFRTLNV